MKIDEAIKMINSTITANAILVEDRLYISDATKPSVGWFLSVPKQAIGWEEVRKQYGLLETVTPADLAHVMDVIQQLLDTPVKDRFPEKKYRLRWIDSKFSELPGLHSFPRYLFISSNCWDMADNDLCGKAIFTESELNKLKKDNPRLAPAIDAMKEPVEDDE